MPPNEEIVFSTVINIAIAISKTVGRSVTTYKCWSLSPLLITPLGFAYYGRPYKNGIYGDALPTYNSLLNILSVTKDGFMVRHIDPIARWPYPYRFTVPQDPNESKAKYKERVNSFKLILLKNIKNAAEHMLKYINVNQNKDEKDYSPIWKVDKSILMDSRDQHIQDFLNYSESIKEAKKSWEQAVLNKIRRSIKNELRNNYLSLMNEALKKFAYKEGNVGYLRQWFDYDLNFETHLHLEELHSKMTKFNEHPIASGVTPTTNTDYRSLFHPKASKRLLKITSLADKKILKVQSKIND